MDATYLRALLAPVLRVLWGESLREALFENSLLLQSEVGAMLVELLEDGPSRELFQSAWADVSPVIRLDAIPVAQRRMQLPGPSDVHLWHQSYWLKKLSAHLIEARVKPGTYVGEEAKRLDTDTIYPWLIGQLRELLAQHDRGEMLRCGAAQLEYLHCQRWWTDKNISLMTGMPDYNDSVVQQLVDRRMELFQLSKAISVLIEELLVSPPSGAHPVDSMAWTDMLSLSALCVESCLSSEMTHKSLGGHRIEVLESGELVFSAEASEQVDLASFHTALETATMPEAIPLQPGDEESGGQTKRDPESVLSVLPDLEPIQNSLLDEHGFGIDALTGVLEAAKHWEVPEGEVFAVTATGKFAEAAEHLHGVVEAEEYQRAVAWLALPMSDQMTASEDSTPIRHWEIERRADRIDTRPFILLGTHLFVLPWTAANAWKIMWNYLSDGRLPWPEEMIGAKASSALAAIRQERNRELEQKCVQAIDHPQLEVRSNLTTQKAQQIGIQELSGEIDVLAVDQRSSRIWVMEVKDRFFPYSPRSISRDIDKFHQPGGHVEKLRGKVDDIGRFQSAIAREMDSDSPQRQWEVKGLFVTRRPMPAAFARDTDVEFCTIEEVRGVVVGHDK